MIWLWVWLLGWLAAALLMSVLWVWQRQTGQSSIVDVAWSFTVGLLGVAFCFLGSGLPQRRWIVAALVSVWAIRLGAYVLQRVLSMPEDGRYQEMHEKWGDQLQKKMFAFYQFQAFGAVLFATPMLVAAYNPAPLGWLDYLGVAVFVVAFVGELVADYQLHRFRKNPQNKGKVCRAGLWNYSRHPNYFFEWLHWWSYFLLALGSPWGWLNLIFPLAMLYFILFKTGIPPTERQALKSRGDAYREYQRTTSAFVPWFPKNSDKPAGVSQPVKEPS